MSNRISWGSVGSSSCAPRMLSTAGDTKARGKVSHAWDLTRGRGFSAQVGAVGLRAHHGAFLPFPRVPQQAICIVVLHMLDTKHSSSAPQLTNSDGGAPAPHSPPCPSSSFPQGRSRAGLAESSLQRSPRKPHFAFKHTVELLATPSKNPVDVITLAARSNRGHIPAQAWNGKVGVSSPDLSSPRDPLKSPNMSFTA